MIFWIQMQLNFENFIFPTFQTPAVGKTLKPYQGLKLSSLKRADASTDRHKNPKTLSGIETSSGCRIPSATMSPLLVAQKT
jgi:hypothetical protein